MNTVSIKLDDEMFKRLKSLSARTKKPASFYIRKALKNQLEDLEDIATAKQELEKIRTGETEIISNEEALKIIYGNKK
jgi:RHH-type rel operon transcriptional repressor/antitoxin RelB